MPERREKSPQTHSTQSPLAARDQDISVRAQRWRPCPARSSGSPGPLNPRSCPGPGHPAPATVPPGPSPGGGGVTAHLGAQAPPLPRGPPAPAAAICCSPSEGDALFFPSSPSPGIAATAARTAATGPDRSQSGKTLRQGTRRLPSRARPRRPFPRQPRPPPARRAAPPSPGRQGQRAGTPGTHTGGSGASFSTPSPGVAPVRDRRPRLSNPSFAPKREGVNTLPAASASGFPPHLPLPPRNPDPGTHGHRGFASTG